MVLGVVAGSIAGYILICCWVLPPIPNFRLRSARDLLRSGIPAASGTASMVGFQNCDYVIVGARLGALQAGYYFRAYTLGVVYQKKVSQVMYVARLPGLVTSHERRRGRPPSPADGSHDHADSLPSPDRTGDRRAQVRHVVLRARMAAQSIVPVQILTIGGAAMLVAEAVTVAMLGTGRARAVMWWGWGHFLVYGAAVFAVARLGLPAVAVAAVVVHTTFLVIAYLQLAHGLSAERSRRSPRTFFPPRSARVGLAAVALPVSVFASTLGIPTVPYLLIIALAGGAGYFLSLRLWFPNELRHLGLLAGRLLPGRAASSVRSVQPVGRSLNRRLRSDRGGGPRAFCARCRDVGLRCAARYELTGRLHLSAWPQAPGRYPVRCVGIECYGETGRFVSSHTFPDQVVLDRSKYRAGPQYPPCEKYSLENRLFWIVTGPTSAPLAGLELFVAAPYSV